MNAQINPFVLVEKSGQRPTEAEMLELMTLFRERETMAQLLENTTRVLLHPPPDEPDASDPCTSRDSGQ